MLVLQTGDVFDHGSLQEQETRMLAGILLKETHQGNVRKTLDTINFEQQKFLRPRKSKKCLDKKHLGTEKTGKSTQRGLPGILEASNSSAP